jgi:isopentenyl-diphosphate delta-isomerase
MCSAIAEPGAVQERIILVNSADEEIGSDYKAAVHRGDGLLHRAFSVYLFDTNASLLLQRRSNAKPLWPGYWSNSCCSHPRPGESPQAAAARRVHEELGIANVGTLSFLFKFEYHARFGGGGAEHEVCSVFAAVIDRPVRIDPREVAATCYVSAAALDRQLSNRPQRFTPWLHLAWTQLRAAHWDTVVQLVSRAT